ncbi:MAG TPA: hypothetical protein VFN68_01990 [Acidimicrobiales bacterium]|nr:hypothetical protein [Acidimicrobiales bacterium]
MTDFTCEGFRHVSAELALGLADAHERAAVLAHLERCPTCRAEIRQLSDVADALAAMAPPAEPPAGFESRVLANLARLKHPPAGWRLPSRRLLQLAAAAVLVAMVGVGGWLLGAASSPAPTIDAGHLVTAKLVASGRTVGDVVVDTDGTPWMSMHLEMGGTSGRFTCRITTASGRSEEMGSFPVSAGTGAWAAALPAGVGSIRTAEVVDPAGRIMASASLPAH